MKITITFDSEIDDNYEERAKRCLDAERMFSAIDNYYTAVFRKYKHRDLTKEQEELLEEIKESLVDHFKDF